MNTQKGISMEKKYAIGALTKGKQNKTSTLYKSPDAGAAKSLSRPKGLITAQKNAPKSMMSDAKKILGGKSLRTKKKGGNPSL